MTREEAEWLAQAILALPVSEVSPMANIGCSDLALQAQQPWLEPLLLRPLRNAGVALVGVDLKDAPNVDIVGDIADPGVQQQVAERGVRSVLCSNLLEHVESPELVAKAMGQLVRGPDTYSCPAGVIIRCIHTHLTTDFVDPAGFARLFEGAEMTRSVVLECGTLWASLRGRRTRWVARLAAPFIRPSEWKLQAQRVPWLRGREYKFSCAVLRLTDESAS